MDHDEAEKLLGADDIWLDSNSSLTFGAVDEITDEPAVPVTASAALSRCADVPAGARRLLGMTDMPVTADKIIASARKTSGDTADERKRIAALYSTASRLGIEASFVDGLLDQSDTIISDRLVQEYAQRCRTAMQCSPPPVSTRYGPGCDQHRCRPAGLAQPEDPGWRDADRCQADIPRLQSGEGDQGRSGVGDSIPGAGEQCQSLRWWRAGAGVGAADYRQPLVSVRQQ
jgi:hypothetical protein